MFNPLKKPARVGILGCGTIGTYVAKFLDSDELPAILAGVCDRDPERAESLITHLKNTVHIYDINKLVHYSDLIVECASAQAVDEIVILCCEHQKHLVVLSIGGLRTEHLERAARSRISLTIPSGAIGGLDAIQAHADAGIEELTLTTRKPPAAYRQVEWVIKQGIDVDDIKGETVLFEGSADSAVERFPQNVNVAGTLKIVSGDFSGLRVRVIADPHVHYNLHEIYVRSRIGAATTRFENLPSPENPKTSALACHSAVATLRKMLSNVKKGT
ncbi:MAG: aspartate dehydrogenase domain-containing protein [bacterium]